MANNQCNNNGNWAAEETALLIKVWLRVHKDPKLEDVSSFITTELSRENYYREVNQVKRKIKDLTHSYKTVRPHIKSLDVILTGGEGRVATDHPPTPTVSTTAAAGVEETETYSEDERAPEGGRGRGGGRKSPNTTKRTDKAGPQPTPSSPLFPLLRSPLFPLLPSPVLPSMPSSPRPLPISPSLSLSFPLLPPGERTLSGFTNTRGKWGKS